MLSIIAKVEDEQVIPASEPEASKPSPDSPAQINKTLLGILVILALLVIGGAAFIFGSKQRTSSTPSPTPTATPSQEASVSATISSEETPGPLATPTLTPTPTPTPTPVSQTIVVSATAALDGWRASNGGRNTDWYIQIGHTNTPNPLTERGYVSFDLSSIPSGTTLEEARLRLYQAEIVGTPYVSNSLLVDHVNYGSSLDSINYDGGVLQTNIGTLTSYDVKEWKDLVVTNSVKDDISNSRTRTQYRLRFTDETPGPDAWARFESADNYLSSGNTPQLVVKYH